MTGIGAAISNWGSEVLASVQASDGFWAFDKGNKGFVTLADLKSYISKAYGRKDDGFITREKFDALMGGKFGVDTKGKPNSLFPDGARMVHYSDLEKLFTKHAGSDGKISKEEYANLRAELQRTVRSDTSGRL